MLILGRVIDEVVVITTPSGETVRVTLVDVRGKRVKLGFQASLDVVIDREEINIRKERNGTNAP